MSLKEYVRNLAIVALAFILIFGGVIVFKNLREAKKLDDEVKVIRKVRARTEAVEKASAASEKIMKDYDICIDWNRVAVSHKLNKESQVEVEEGN